MKRSVLYGLAAFVACASAPASAADWWWVSGDAADGRMTFVDAASLQGQGTVSVRSVSIDRTGNAVAETHKVRCAEADAGEIARFACASSDQRRKSFAMLGSLNPLEAAQAMFRASGPAMNASTPRSSRPIGDEALPSEA